MYLSEIIAAKKQRLVLKKETFTSSLIKRIENKFLNEEYIKRSFYDAIRKEGLSIIGEIKKASPSKGIINNNFIIDDVIDEYNNSVDAISVLTEEDFFLGSPEILKNVSEKSKVPVLMKDFIIDPVQIYEAKYYGGDSVLLIADILEYPQLQELYLLAQGLGLDSLIEIHNEKDLEKALKINAKIIGINNRDLTTFQVNLDHTKKLVELIPKDILKISESGIMDVSDVKFLKGLKIDGILVGEAFMKSSSIRELAGDFRDA